jgi:hypothetical protein
LCFMVSTSTWKKHTVSMVDEIRRSHKLAPFIRQNPGQ